MELHGRERELVILDEMLAAVDQGRGRALFFTGEAGIGKSALLREARTRARLLVVEGAAWESGGAPPYWPWQQVVRDVIEELGQEVHTLPGADRLGSIVPALGALAQSATAPDTGAARFALIDALVQLLLAASRKRPLIVLLDDLHASDVPSLDVLALLVRELPRAPLGVVACWRESELAMRPDVAQRLSRASRAGVVVSLPRLTADEVARWVGTNAAAIYATSEGNPLFVEEMLRAQRAGRTPSTRTTSGIAHAIDEHVALLPAAAHTLLGHASVLGRELDHRLVAALAGIDDDDAVAMLREAAKVGVVELVGATSRFRHVLLRDHFYDHLAPSERSRLHQRAGELLAGSDATRAAHHLLAASSRDVMRAVMAARDAADRARSIFAFEDAVDLLAAALHALDATATAGGLAQAELAIDVRIELADGRHHLGQTEGARAECVRAAELARARGDVDRLARAAMVYARELASGTRDPVMIALLEEARAALAPGGDGASLARVMARLAAALVPGPEPEILRGQALANAAVAMARRLDDPETLLFALRYAGHAHAYQISIAEALANTEEVIALSDQLRRPLESVDHRAWLVGARLCPGDLAGSQRALESFEALLAPLSQPHYRWRVPIVQAAWLVRAGRFHEAERRIAAAAELGREYDLERACWAALFAELGLIATWRDSTRAGAFVESIRAVTRIGPIAHGLLAFVLALAGRTEDAALELDRTRFVPALITLQFAAEAIVLVGADHHARAILSILEAQCALHPFAYGPQGGVIVRPSIMVLGDIYALLGRLDDAVAALERGLALARTIEAPPFIAHGAASLSRVLLRRGRAADADRARSLEDECRRLCSVLCIAPFAPARPVQDASPHRALAIACDDKHATVRWRDRELALPIAKGFEFLAALVGAPGHEIHVSELAGDVDTGDAGEILDARARDSYKRRIADLEHALADAQDRNDLGRLDGLTSELEAVTDQLLAGTGLGGRARRAGSRVERARVNVQRRIKDAVRRIAAEDADLARYLEATIRTGVFCSYVPLD
jgi:tetratricopeptide (TPR) repeat protein